MIRGDIFTVNLSGRSGHEQKGSRLAIILQTNDLPLSTVVIVPTSPQARPTSFRPSIRIQGEATYALTEQITTVDTQRLGKWIGHVTDEEIKATESGIKSVLGMF